jgi:hypothetical protein
MLEKKKLVQSTHLGLTNLGDSLTLSNAENFTNPYTFAIMQCLQLGLDLRRSMG